MVRAVKFGVWDPPDRPFEPGAGKELGDVPQDAESLSFGQQEVEAGLRTQLWTEVTRRDAERAVRKGRLSPPRLSPGPIQTRVARVAW